MSRRSNGGKGLLHFDWKWLAFCKAKLPHNQRQRPEVQVRAAHFDAATGGLMHSSLSAEKLTIASQPSPDPRLVLH